MLTTIRAMILPPFQVDLSTTDNALRVPRQCDVLTVQDEIDGHLELVFLSPRDLRAFLTQARQALTSFQRHARAETACQRLRLPSADRGAPL